jgi:hypothetical protein
VSKLPVVIVRRPRVIVARQLFGRRLLNRWLGQGAGVVQANTRSRAPNVRIDVRGEMSVAPPKEYLRSVTVQACDGTDVILRRNK